MDDLEALKTAAWKKNQAIVPRYFMRPLSIRLTWLLIRTDVSATQITLLSFALKVVAALLFLQGKYLLNVSAGVLLYFSLVFDCVDGEVARVKNQVTRSGALLDYFLDRLGDFGVYSSVTLALLLISGNERYDPRIVILGMFVLASTLFNTTIELNVEDIKEKAGVEATFGLAGRAIQKHIYLGISGIELILLFSSLLDRMLEGMLVIGVLSFSYAVVRFSSAYVFFTRKERTNQKFRSPNE